MDFVPYEQREKLFSAAFAKLRRGGVITLNGVDFDSVGQYMSNGMTSVNHINNTLFGGKLSVGHSFDLKNWVKKRDARLVNLAIEGLQYIAKIKRKDAI